MIKVAHFIDSPDPGGAESIVIDLCIQEKRENLTVEVLYFDNPWLERKCKENDIPSFKVPFFNLYKSKFTLPFFSILFAFILIKRKIDIIHTHLFDPIIAASPAAFISRTAHVATLHDVYSIEHNKSRHYVLKMSTLLRSRIVAVSNQIITHLNEYGIVSNNAIVLIRNGVNIEKFKTGSAERGSPPGSGVDNGDIVIICVGRLVPIKGHSHLLMAFNNLAHIVSSIKLVIIGDGPELNSLSNLAEKLAITDKVVFMGHRDDVSDFLQKSDIFALASLSEGLSCSIIEAMASGLPVVATDVGGNNELVKNGITGYLVTQGDIDMFSNRLMDLIKDRNKRLMFSEESQKIARKEFSTESMCAKYMELYSKLLNKNNCE